MNMKTVKYRQEVINIAKLRSNNFAISHYISPSELRLSEKSSFDAIHYAICLAVILVSVIKLVFCIQRLNGGHYEEENSEAINTELIVFFIFVNCIDIFLPIYSLLINMMLPKIKLYFFALGTGFVTLLCNFIRIAFRVQIWQNFMKLELIIADIIALALLYGWILTIGVMLRSLQLSQRVKVMDF